MKISKRMIIATMISAILVSGVSVLNAAERTSLDLSTINFSQPEFARHLINGQHERVEIQGLGGLYYGLAAYLNGVEMCPALLQRSVASFVRLSEPAVYGLLIRMFESRLKMDEANDTTELVNAMLEGPALLIAMNVAMNFGRSDVEALVSATDCQAPETARFVSAAEKLAEALLVVSKQGEKPYTRPASLAGLPEETQRLFDEYYLCRVRTRTFYMVPGGAQDPCDDELFSFKTSEARATGRPAPTREFVHWQSSQGVVGKYEEHPIGVVVVIDEAPEHFTPHFADSLIAKLGNPCVICGAKDGWIIGMGIYFKLNHNDGKRGRLTDADIYRMGYADWTEHGWILRCGYYIDDRFVNEGSYWYKSKPGAEFFRRDLGRPLPKILGVREQCSAIIPPEISSG